MLRPKYPEGTVVSDAPSVNWFAVKDFDDYEDVSHGPGGSELLWPMLRSYVEADTGRNGSSSCFWVRDHLTDDDPDVDTVFSRLFTFGGSDPALSMLRSCSMVFPLYALVDFVSVSGMSVAGRSFEQVVDRRRVHDVAKVLTIHGLHEARIEKGHNQETFLFETILVCILVQVT